MTVTGKCQGNKQTNRLRGIKTGKYLGIKTKRRKKRIGRLISRDTIDHTPTSTQKMTNEALCSAENI